LSAWRLHRRSIEELLLLLEWQSVYLVWKKRHFSTADYIGID
jgi:hypothetical protein